MNKKHVIIALVIGIAVGMIARPKVDAYRAKKAASA